MLTTKEAIKLRAMLINENRALRQEANRLLKKPASSAVADRAWQITSKRITDNTETIRKLESMRHFSQIVKEN